VVRYARREGKSYGRKTDNYWRGRNRSCFEVRHPKKEAENHGKRKGLLPRRGNTLRGVDLWKVTERGH